MTLRSTTSEPTTTPEPTPANGGTSRRNVLVGAGAATMIGVGAALAPLPADASPKNTTTGSNLIKVGHENSLDININYYDHGKGQPVILIHGYPLDARSWEKQEKVLVEAGYRVISYDRRGFGKSSQPFVGYNYDTFARDLRILIKHLDLDDAILVGFSMGTGEVARYLGRYGSGRISKAVLLGSVPPYLIKTPANPLGVDRSVFDGIKAAVIADRPAYFKSFLDNFYNVDVLPTSRISTQAWQASFDTAINASAYAAYACVDSWLEDFRADLRKIDIPVLLMHGTADRILPYASTAARVPRYIKDVQVIPVKDGPHNIAWTFPEVVNPALLKFLAS